MLWGGMGGCGGLERGGIWDEGMEQPPETMTRIGLGCPRAMRERGPHVASMPHASGWICLRPSCSGAWIATQGIAPPLTDPGSGARGSVDEVPEIHNRRLSLYGGSAEFGLRTDGFAPGQVPDGLIQALRIALFENE